MVEWYYNKQGKPTPQAHLLNELISERSTAVHGMVRTEEELVNVSRSLLFRFQTLLYKAKWL